MARRARGGDDSGDGRVNGHVIRYRTAHVCGALPISDVATVTISRRPSCTDVAGNAERGRGNVQSGQGETSRVVIKDRAQPGARCMARLASLGVTGSDVIRDPGEVRGALPGRDVAPVAGWRTERVVVVYMARAAKYLRGRVRSRQGKPSRGVVERGTCPVQRGVTNGAVLREPCRDVIRNVAPQRRRALPVQNVAPVAGCGFERVIVAHVAGSAGHVGMPIGQRKPGRAVIETCRRPTYCVMAYRTIRRRKLRSRRRVHRIIRLLPSR
jgi:hypothetical protein